MPFPALSSTSVLNTRPLIGWQTLLADLSLILFMVTAAAVESTPDVPKPAIPGQTGKSAPAAPRAADPRSEPIAVWRATGAAPPLRTWLRQQSPDPRQQLTIAVHYAGGARALPPALAHASSLGHESEAAGVPARVLVEPGPDDVVATLAYDRAGNTAPTGTAPTGTTIAGKRP